MSKPVGTVVITGASGGIGRATAIAFARRGAKVALLARGEKGLEGARREVEQAGGTGRAFPADVTDFHRLQEVCDEVEAAWGPIDVWVNNAMVTVFGPISELTPAEVEQVTRVTYLGAVNSVFAVLPRMRRRDAGTIVQVASALAYQSVPLQSAYCGAKAALRAFMDSLRMELRHEGSAVDATMVQLAAFNTTQFDWARSHMDCKPQPLPPIFQPEMAADAIVQAALRPKREFWVGWPAAQAILGAKFAPWLTERMLSKQAWSGQMSASRQDNYRPGNLEEAVEGDFGAHGRFDERARNSNWQWRLSRAWNQIFHR